MGKTHDYSGYVGYIKVEGPDLEGGQVDIQSIKNTVLGTEHLLKYFLVKQSPGVNFKDEVNFTIEVRDGCWEILVPVGVAVAFMANSYFGEALKTMAKNDVGDKTTVDVFKGAFKGAQAVVKIAKHLGTMKVGHTIEGKPKSTEHIEIRNSKGEILVVTKHELEEYQAAPRDLLSSVAYPAVNDRTVHIGYVELGRTVDQIIRPSDREIFHVDEDEHTELFPELEHGMSVELEGYVSRGNQKTNTIGFEYKGHILTCEPVRNYVANYIHAHYKRAHIKGMVSRRDANGEETGRPRIHFTDLVPISAKQLPQQELL